jgi:hypothetical protein
MKKRVILYKIQVNYKSGKTIEFWCDDFTMTGDAANKVYSWVRESTVKIPALVCPAPLNLNVDEVESVWTVEQKSFTI